MIILKWHAAYLKADLTHNKNTQKMKANAQCDLEVIYTHCTKSEYMISVQIRYLVWQTDDSDLKTIYILKAVAVVLKFRV